MYKNFFEWVRSNDIKKILENYFNNKGEIILERGRILPGGVVIFVGKYTRENGNTNDILVTTSDYQCVVKVINVKDLLKSETLDLSEEYKQTILEQTEKYNIGAYYEYRDALKTRLLNKVDEGIAQNEENRFNY